MKVIIVGATHAGTFAAQQILTDHPGTQVTVYEKNDTVSFLSCGIALWVGDHVSDPEKMFYSSPEALTGLGANMKMKHEVTAINPETKTVTVTDLTTNQVATDSYDKLVVTTGSAPIIPPIEGIDNQNVYLCKNWDDAKKLQASAKQIKSAIVIGSGYIGAELAEQYSLTDKEVTLIDALPRVLAKNFDRDITDQVEQEYRDHDVKLALGEKVVSFSGEDQITVTTDKGSYTADIAVLCTGFRPRTELMKGKVDMLPNGAIITDDYMRSSNLDIFAAGDSAAVHYNPTGKNDYIPLATNAVRQGILVGHNLVAPTEKYLGTQATSAVELYGQTIAASGLTAEGAKVRNVDYETVTIKQDYRPDFMLSTTSILCTLTWDPKTHQVLGGAFYSAHDVSVSANVISLAIQTKMTIETLSMVDMFFQPNFDQPLNWINALAMAAVAKEAEKVTN
ncbi:FAD-dependent oxidoreductase [Furfurilactobacillus curtus]|uniref:Pyridine nucleotide-disulfide oxidoreductase n=1 Tax=Furfurilactobacillus curtus TaxID=1746200 RepID=A0ABQ5JP60_9LACO